MADRVHPAADDDHQHAASAPPYRGDGSAAMDYDAEKAIRKEQEQSLMAASRGEEEEGHGEGEGDGEGDGGGRSSSVGSSPAGKRSSSSAQPSPSPAAKDIIYRMPPPLPADHPSNKAKIVVGGGDRKRRSKGRCCCCCVMWTLAAAMAAAVILGAAAGIAWLILQPKTPAFDVKEASVAKLEMAAARSAAEASGAPAMAIDASVNLTVEATNPNSKIGIYYDAIAVSLLYQGQGIGNGSVPAFYQRHGNVRVLQVELRGQEVAISQLLASSLNATLSDPSQDLPLASQAQIQARLKLGSWTSGPARVDLACAFTISNPRASSTVSLLSKSCSFKLRSLKIFSTSF